MRERLKLPPEQALRKKKKGSRQSFTSRFEIRRLRGEASVSVSVCLEGNFLMEAKRKVKIEKENASERAGRKRRERKRKRGRRLRHEKMKSDKL